jgi:hypothetical protein
MRFHSALLIAVTGLAGAGPAGAEDITFQLNNMSEKSIVSLLATPKGESGVSETNLLQAGAVGPAETGEVTIAAADAACVYNLKIGYGDGSVLERPDVDLCQTDALIIE